MSNVELAGDWFDAETGLIRDRSIFTDEAIYQMELERIYGRAWNFMCHESQIAQPGQFFMNYIGEDEVIIVRDQSGSIQVLLNSCPHRGNTVCRAEQGTTNSFFCSYHGWNFALDGRLVGMPGEEEFYRGGIDKSEWGLTPAAQVDSYKGFVFATLDACAPPLQDYLGWVGRLGIDSLAELGELEVVDGIQKNRLQCNWKFAADNLFDWYHVKASHGSALRAGLLPWDVISPDYQMVMFGEYGHGIGGPGMSQDALDASLRRTQQGGEGDPQWYDPWIMARSEKMRETLGPVGARQLGHTSIFPNLWITINNQICLRIPRGPLETELWWFTLLPKDLPPEARRQAVSMAIYAFGPSGMLEQDDGENWSHSTRGAKGTRSRTLPLNYAMGLGMDEVRRDPSGQDSIETVISEHGQRWAYQSWQDWMNADSWEALIADHTLPPRGRI